MKYSRKRKNNLNDFRLSIVMIGMFVCFLLVDLRLFQIQVLGHSKYSSIAQSQYWDEKTLPARRGSIYSSDEYLLAGTQMHYLMYAEPKVINNKEELSTLIASKLSELRYKEEFENTQSENIQDEVEINKSNSTDIQEDFGDDEEDVKKNLFSNYYFQVHDLINKDLFWVPLFHGVTPVEREEIEKMGLLGIGFEEEPLRYYPEDTLASHILGFVASTETGEKRGYYGIEGALNDELKGKSGRIMEEQDANGTPILMGNYQKIEPVQGRDVVLTINRSIQYLVEKKLKEGVEKYDANSGTVIVMDPLTGSILAMANYPTYHPADFTKKESPLEDVPHRKNLERVNYAISRIYEPGSVLKALTVSSAVDLNLVTPDTTFEDNGPVVYSDYTINNWDGNHHGTQTIVQLLQKSNNIGAAWVGHRVGSKDLFEYLYKFGLGKKTGIELEGEDTGNIRDVKTWTDIDLATISFGQGVSATPLQVLNVFNTIANGGYLLKPRIISHLYDGDKLIEIPVKKEEKVISKETSDTMIFLLEKAAEGGEAKYFILKDYRISGKTGTAQIPENGKYSPNRTNATFVGFLTGSKKFSMIVKLEEPKTSTYASETAVPLWMDITSELVKYFGLLPDKEKVDAISMPLNSQYQESSDNVVPVVSE